MHHNSLQAAFGSVAAGIGACGQQHGLHGLGSGDKPVTDARLLALLRIDSHISRETAEWVVHDIERLGLRTDVAQIIRVLRQARAPMNPVTLEYTVPGHVQPRFGYDNLQDALAAAGYRDHRLYYVWAIVKAHLRQRWSQGNYNEPRTATVLRWAKQAGA